MECWQATRGLDSLDSVNFLSEGIKTETCVLSHHAFMYGSVQVLCIMCFAYDVCYQVHHGIACLEVCMIANACMYVCMYVCMNNQ